MIWQETTNGEGEVYFTDTLNGNRVNYFTNEIAEIERLISNYNYEPSFANKTYNTYTRRQLYLGATEEMLKHYKVTSDDIMIDGSTVVVKTLQEAGEFEYELVRTDTNYNKPIIFYQSNNSQNLMETGDLGTKRIKFKVIVKNPTITINKVDKDTLEAIPQGEASLDGAVYEIYQNKTRIGKITIENGKGTLKTSRVGKFTIKEVIPGNGYTLDPNTYEFTITDDDLNQEITLSNKVIEKKVKIIKKYGEENNFIGEENIEFGIYNKNSELVDTIITNSDGEAYIVLPYGEYEIIQLTTTDGYTMVEPLTIIVEDTDDITIELKDYKIPVPDTKSNISFINLLFRFIYILIC